MKLKTKRLVLEPMTLQELEQAYQTEQDTEMKKAYQDMLDGCRKYPKEHLWHTNWKITKRENGEQIGGIGWKYAPRQKEVEIGYDIKEPYRRQGYGTEAVEKMIEWAFSNRDVYYVMAETLPDNTASRKLLKKLGFTEAGEGEEGLRFEKEAPQMHYLPIFMSMGMCWGIWLGMMGRHLYMGLPLGMGLSVLLGAVLDKIEKDMRKQLKEERAGRGKQYDKETMYPVIRASICNGEQVAGFKNKQTGAFQEERFLQKPEDLDDFCRQYGIQKEEIRKEY